MLDSVSLLTVLSTEAEYKYLAEVTSAWQETPTSLRRQLYLYGHLSVFQERFERSREHLSYV